MTTNTNELHAAIAKMQVLMTQAADRLAHHADSLAESHTKNGIVQDIAVQLILQSETDLIDAMRAAALPWDQRQSPKMANAQLPPVFADWVWSWLMDWCQRQGFAPATQDSLFTMVQDARRKFDDASVQVPVAFLFTNVQSGDAEASTDPDHKQGEREMWFRENLVRPFALPPQSTKNEIEVAISNLERIWHRLGELWERCQGKGWPQAESDEFEKLRDEVAPEKRAALLALATPPAAFVRPVAFPDLPLTPYNRKDGAPLWDTHHLHAYALRYAALITSQATAHPAYCTWAKSNDPEMPDTYEATCGAIWTFTDGGPTDNNMHFCPKCGSKVVEGDAA